MTTPRERGFSLVELMIVLVVLGLVLGFSIPPLQRLSSTFQLQTATENIAGQMRLAREKALATGVVQPITFRLTDYRTTPATGVSGAWRLPRGITYAWSAGTDSDYVFQTDGRCDRAGLVVLQNLRGVRDTVSVQLSGLVLTY